MVLKNIEVVLLVWYKFCVVMHATWGVDKRYPTIRALGKQSVAAINNFLPIYAIHWGAPWPHVIFVVMFDYA